MLKYIVRQSLLLTGMGLAMLSPAIAGDQAPDININSLLVSNLDIPQLRSGSLDVDTLTNYTYALTYQGETDESKNSLASMNESPPENSDTRPPSQEGELITLDLNELITIALKNNRMIEVVRQQLAQTLGQLTQAKSGYLPKLDLLGKYSYTERKDSASSGSSLIDERTGQRVQSPEESAYSSETEEDDVVHGAVNISQLIYDFGKTTGSIDVGRSNSGAADAQLQRQIQDIVFQVKVAYYNVLEKRRLIDVARESVKSFEQHLERANVYKRAGVRTQIDVINAEVELSNANMQLLRAQYNLKNARVQLEQVLGTKPNRGEYQLYSKEVQLDNIIQTMPPVPEHLDDLIAYAMEQRPDLLQLRRLMEAAEANLRSIKGDYWPAVSADANYNDYDTDLSLYKDSWEVGVVARWQLFSGFQTDGMVAEARGRLLENKALLEDTQLVVVREVTESYLQTDENRESVEIALQTLELAKENVLLAEKRYRSGANDVLEFNDAQLNLTRARAELVAIYYGYLSSLAGIEFAIGNNLDMDGGGADASPPEDPRYYLSNNSQPVSPPIH
ncbi:MAG: TolC family protein [Desulforhopalus sp.]